LPALFIAALLAGCSGGSSTLTPADNAGAGSAAAKHASVTLRIKIPPKHAAQGARAPKYVSPATQSIAISFTPAAGGATQTFNQNLTPSTPGCVASLVSPLICTVTLSVGPGNYVATFTTYDGVLDGNDAPQGNILSENQGVAVTVASGKTNDVNVTLQGVPVSVAIAAVGGTASARGATAFTIDKCFTTQKFEIVGVDADGNYILGPGAPTASLTGGTGILTIAGPAQANPNLFTLTRTGLPAGLTTVPLSATLTPGTGGPPAAPATTLALTFNTSNCGVDSIVGSGFNTPVDAVSDAHGNVYVVDVAAGVEEVANGGTTAVPVAPGHFTTPTALTIDQSGDLFVTDATLESVQEISASRAVTTVATGFVFPTGIAITPGGNLYVADSVANRVELIPRDGNGVPVSVGTGYEALSGVALDANNIVYVADQDLGILEVEPGGSLQTIAPGNALILQPFGIAVDPVGNIYFSDLALGAVNKIAPDGTVTAFASNLAEPEGVFVAPNGDIYVADANGPAVHRYR